MSGEGVCARNWSCMRFCACVLCVRCMRELVVFALDISLLAIVDALTDIAELDGGTVAVVTFPNPNDLTNFHVTVTPDSGYWRSATYHFDFAIPAIYPH